MLAVLSFVRMLLEPAMDSRVFRPPNPWLMAILALLVEVRGVGPEWDHQAEWGRCGRHGLSLRRAGIGMGGGASSAAVAFPSAPTAICCPPTQPLLLITAALLATPVPIQPPQVYNLDNIKTGLKFEVSPLPRLAGVKEQLLTRAWKQLLRLAGWLPAAEQHVETAAAAGCCSCGCHSASPPLSHTHPPTLTQVELLFKSMNMQLQDVPPSSLLAGRRRESLDNSDFQAQRPTSQGGVAPGATAPGGTPSKDAAPAAAAAAGGEGKPAPPAPGACAVGWGLGGSMGGQLLGCYLAPVRAGALLSCCGSEPRYLFSMLPLHASPVLCFLAHAHSHPSWPAPSAPTHPPTQAP